MTDTNTHLTLDQVQQSFGQLATFKELFYDWQGLNAWLFKLINGLHGPVYDKAMLLITQLGVSRFFPYILGGLAAYAVVSGLWRRLRRKAGVKQHFIMWLGIFAVLLAGYVVSVPAIHLLKDHFAYPRPYAALGNEKVVVLEERPADDSRRGFPSGHVSFITLIVIGVWPVLSSRMRWAGGALIFLVAWSRMALGVHFPADVAGGFLLTFLIVALLRLVIYSALRKIGINCGGG